MGAASNAKEIADSVEQQHLGVNEMVETIREFASQSDRQREAVRAAESAGGNVRQLADALLEAAKLGSTMRAS
jgi:methyl-accepting chemotaxis protein